MNYISLTNIHKIIQAFHLPKREILPFLDTYYQKVSHF